LYGREAARQRAGNGSAPLRARHKLVPGERHMRPRETLDADPVGVLREGSPGAREEYQDEREASHSAHEIFVERDIEDRATRRRDEVDPSEIPLIGEGRPC